MAWLAFTMALPFAASRAQTFLPVPLDLSSTGSNTGHAVVPSIAVGPSGEIDVVWLECGSDFVPALGGWRADVFVHDEGPHD